MTRILSYNILVGGTGRVNQLTQIILSANPDVVGLVEATNPHVVEALAERLGMQYRISDSPKHSVDWQVALLSRLPIVRTQVHTHPGVLMKPVLEVDVEEANGHELTVFVTHLSADFSRGWAGDGIRRREVREILRIMQARQGMPHLLMGDFNALAPGDRLKGSRLLSYLVEMDRRHAEKPKDSIGHPYLDFVVPAPLRIFNPLLRAIPRSQLLCTLFDEAGALYAPRGSIRLLRNAGYVDSFRRMNSQEWGFTCPSAAPAGRIDFIFASPDLAERLSACRVITEADGLPAEEASDHLPVVADFGEGVTIEDQKEYQEREEVRTEFITSASEFDEEIMM
jgi:endonuclease/exonuclease/phosphatase family metal-dependent hydrolase